MTDSFQFDLNNSSNYPVLNGLNKHLHSFFPNELKGNERKILNEKNTSDTTDAIKQHIEVVKGLFKEINISNYQYQLIDERDNRLANNIAGDEQRKNNVESYNKKVKEKCFGFWVRIIEKILDTYPKSYGHYMINSLMFDDCFHRYEHYFWTKNKKDKIEPLQEIPEKPIHFNNPLPEKILVATINKRIKWTGTPGEFGAIFNLLLDKGYIEIVKDKTNMAKVFNEIFEIKTEKNSTPSDKYLYKCFGEKEKKYNPQQLKIPFSDNYHKDK